VEFADHFGATVDVSVPAADVGLFVVCRHPATDHARFRDAVAAAVGGSDRVFLDSPGGLVVVATRFDTAQALRAHPAVAHVGGVTVDPERLHRPVVASDVGTRTDR
jgi:hypothetical protein